MKPAPAMTSRAPPREITPRRAMASSMPRKVITPGRPVMPGRGRALGPGRDHEPVVGDPAAVLEPERARRQVETVRLRPEIELDPERVDLACCLQSAAGEVPRAREELLRKRGTVIGKAMLAAHEPQTPFESLFAKGFAGAKPGHARADDDDGPERRRYCYLPSSS